MHVAMLQIPKIDEEIMYVMFQGVWCKRVHESSGQW